MIGESDVDVGYAAGLHGLGGEIRVALSFAFSHSGLDMLSQLGRDITETPDIAIKLLSKPENNLKVPSYLSMRGLGM